MNAEQSYDERRDSFLSRVAAGDEEVEKIDAMQCPSCDAIFEDEPDHNPSYECDSCGEAFSAEENDDSNRCPYCNKFAGKAFEETCPECGEGIDGYVPVEAAEFEGDLVALKQKEGRTA